MASHLKVHWIGLYSLVQSLNQIYRHRGEDGVLLTVNNCAGWATLPNKVLDGETRLDACLLGLALYVVVEQNWVNCTRSCCYGTFGTSPAHVDDQETKETLSQ